MKWLDKWFDVAFFTLLGIAAAIGGVVELVKGLWYFGGVLLVGAAGLGLLVYHSVKNNWTKS